MVTMSKELTNKNGGVGSMSTSQLAREARNLYMREYKKSVMSEEQKQKQRASQTSSSLLPC